MEDKSLASEVFLGADILVGVDLASFIFKLVPKKYY